MTRDVAPESVLAGGARVEVEESRLVLLCLLDRAYEAHRPRRNLELVDRRFIVPDPQCHVEVRADGNRARLNRPIKSRVAAARTLLERKVDDCVFGCAKPWLGRNRWRSIG